MTERALTVDGLVNARDLGGLPLLSGGLTPAAVFHRSESVDRVTAEGWEQIRDAGIRTIVDLRHPGERDQDAGPRPGWLTTIAVDLDGPENRDFWTYYEDSNLDGTALCFLPHLAAMPERMGAALTALARAPEGGVLFHCAGGRDRTGLVAMVLLTIAGVEPEAIVEDYLETVLPSDPRRRTEEKTAYEALVEQVLSGHGTTTEKAFRDALAGLDVDDLLHRAALPADVRAGLESWRGHRDSSYPQLLQTVLDCTSPRALAEFYRQLLGLVYRDGDEPARFRAGDPEPDWLVLLTSSGERCLAFQQVAELAPTTWPEPGIPQQMHLDTTVASRADLDTQHDRALALGARLVQDRADDPQEPLRVYADPAGHLFCIFVA